MAPATTVANAESHAGTPERRLADMRHCPTTRGQLGSRTARLRSMQPAHGETPGVTNGPTNPVLSTTPPYRCGVPDSTNPSAAPGSGA